jgi:hypothetical protein
MTTTRATHTERPSAMTMARRRGVVSGVLLILLGAWGAIIPFVGHSFSYGFTPDNTWAWTAARGWLEVLPGAATFLGGAILTVSADRVSATIAGWLAAAAGAWFVIGTVIAPVWSAGNIGVPVGSTDHAVLERIGMFDGLGLVIVLLAAIALGRVSVLDRAVVTSEPLDSGAVNVVELPQYPVETPASGPATAPATTTARTSANSPVVDEPMPSSPTAPRI